MIQNITLQVFAYKTSTNTGYIVAIIVIILFFILLKVVTTWKDAQTTTRKKKKLNSVNYTTITTSTKEMKTIASMFKFSEEQTDFLRNLFISNKIIHPEQFIQDSEAVQSLFDKTFAHLESIEPTTRSVERQKTILFTIKEAIDTRKKIGELITSTRALKPGLGFTMSVQSGEQYQSAIIENETEGVLCLIPRDLFGNELRLPIRMNIEVFFIGITGQSYRIKTKIIKYVSSRSKTYLLLKHTDSIDALPNRKHNRKIIKIPCTFSHVIVANIVNGKHTEHKFYPQAKTFKGTIEDVSAGGCSILTETPLPLDEYLEIKCMLVSGINDVIIGKVVKINEEETGQISTMHVKFAKMPRASMNRIFAIIYINGENIT